MFKTTFIAAALLSGSAAVAVAGGYVAPVVETAPVVVAPVVETTADWTGFYGGLQFGKSDVEVDGGAELDGNHYGVHAGYLRDFGRFVGGAEVSYDKLDNLDGDGFDAEGNLLRGKLLAGYDAGRVLPYAAVSVARGELEIGGDDADETGFGYGVGVKFMATPRFMLGAEYMVNTFEVDTGLGDVDIDASTLGLNASFRF